MYEIVEEFVNDIVVTKFVNEFVAVVELNELFVVAVVTVAMHLFEFFNGICCGCKCI